MSKEYEQIRTKIAKEYKERLNESNNKVKYLEEENKSLQEKITTLENELSEKNEFIEKMKAYANCSEDDIKTLVESEKAKEEVRKLFFGFHGIMRQYM